MDAKTFLIQIIINHHPSTHSLDEEVDLEPHQECDYIPVVSSIHILLWTVQFSEIHQFDWGQ